VVDADDNKSDTRPLLALSAVIALTVFGLPLAVGLPLVDPDEGFHAAVAQEMVERGDWITPRFLGEPFLDKPALFCWTQAAAIECLGMNVQAVRLPGLLFGPLAMLATGAAGWRMFGRTVGVIAAMFYATMILPLALTQAPAPDVALVPWVVLAILLFWESDRARSRRARLVFAAGAGVVLGLACLTKGLVGVALVGVSYGSYLLVTRRLTVAACLDGGLALSVAACTAGAWYAAMEVRSPGYLYYYFVERHVLAFDSGTQRHAGGPWWYYVPILIGGGLPWVAYLPSGIRDAWARRNGQRGRPAANGGLAMVGCWLVGSTLLLSVANSKLVTYVWPVFPSIALLAAVAWGRLLDGRLARAGRDWMAAAVWTTTLAGMLALPAAALVTAIVLGVRFGCGPWAVVLAVAAATAVPLGFWRSGRYRTTLAAGPTAIVAQFVVLLTLIAPRAASVNTAGDLAAYFNRTGRVPPKVLIVEDRVGSLVFYLDARLRADLVPGQLIGLRAKRLPDALSAQPDALVVVADWRLNRVRRYVDLPDAGFRRAGRYRLYRSTQLHACR
jgi:4-amino-4-deoxy-L-arabinose transferase-like glycosyltransferase